MRLETVEPVSRQRQTVAVAADRWGRYPIRGSRDCRCARRTADRAPASVDAADVFVFPLAPPQSTAIPRTELLDRLGTHLTRHIGPGVEYADVRRYVPGDQLRTVNWPVQRAARQPARHRAADRPRRRRGGADRQVSAAAGPGHRGDRPHRARRGASRAERAAQRRSRGRRRARRPPPALARRRHRAAAVLPGARRGAGRGRRFRDHAGHAGAAGGPSAGRDRRRVLHPARHRIRAGADRSAQARPHRGRRRRAGGRPVRRRARPRWSPGCGHCSGRSCTATWARSASTWCRGAATPRSIRRCSWCPTTGARCGGERPADEHRR